MTPWFDTSFKPVEQIDFYIGTNISADCFPFAMEKKYYLLMILVGVTLVTLSWSPGPLGLPGWFTFANCPTTAPNGLANSCIYVYEFDFVAIFAGILIAAVALFGVIPLKPLKTQSITLSDKK